MDHASRPAADHPRRVLDTALDMLGRPHARPEAERALDESRLRQIVVVLSDEDQALRMHLEAPEHQLAPADADLDALEREVERRAPSNRARQPRI
jgi:hypothetical protein